MLVGDLIRSKLIRRIARKVTGGIGASLLADATAYLNGVTPYHWFDFINNRALYASADVGNVTQATGYSFSRASTGYYTNSDGTLTSFASGAMRRGDRGVLIEGARTNLLLRSQEFNDASWTKSRSSVTANAATAPDNTTTAEKLVEDTATGTHRTFQAVTKAASAIQYTYTVFLKAAERTFAQVKISDSTESDNAAVDVNLATGAISAVSTVGFTGASATISALANGWYRIALTATSDTDTGIASFVFAASALGTVSYTGDGTSGILMWGAQLEAASFPSSYIPTTTASATRAADVLTYTAGLTYPLGLWAEFERAVDTGAIEAILCMDAGGAPDRVRLDVSAADLGQIISASGGVTQATVTVAGSLNLATVYRLAGRVSTNSVQAARSGTLGTEDTVATNPATPSIIRVGTSSSSGNELFGYIRRIAATNFAPTDAQLTAMTT